MPPATKRRKVSPTTTVSSTGHAVQRGIQAFGKISKSQVRDPGSGKYSAATRSKDAPKGGNGNKRKVGSIDGPTEEEQEGETALRSSEQARIVESGSGSPAERLSDQKTNSRKGAPFPSSSSSDVETPTKGARSCLEFLALAPSSPLDSSSSSRTTDHGIPSSPPASAQIERPQRYESVQLPDELQDLVDLHSSFLTILSLHYAHNGSMTPADLRNLAPGIERVWRRKVTSDDVRRIMAIGWPRDADGQERQGHLYLSDYGNGKICVEGTDHTDARATTRRPIREKILRSLFLRDLEQRWICYKTNDLADLSPSNFIASLALLPIRPCSSLVKITPLFSKGQRRLEDLKAGAIKAQQKPLSATSANPTNLPQPKTKQISARSTDLFTRLKVKQLHQSTLPLPPSAEALARKSALQRLQDITPVLECLVNSSKKHDNEDAAEVGVKPIACPVSFTMPTLVQHLQMSLRKPIGKDEALRSVKVLAEVAPEWVELKEVGKMLGVTIKGTRLTKDEIRRRVESLPADP